MQPIDVIKTRLQLDHIGKYKGGVLGDNARHLCISPDGGGLLVTTFHSLPVSVFALVDFHRHIPLRRDNYQGRGCAGSVEGTYALCSASHLEVCSAHGYKRNVPKRASRRGMQVVTCCWAFTFTCMLAVLCYISHTACMHVAGMHPAKAHSLHLHQPTYPCMTHASFWK